MRTEARPDSTDSVAGSWLLRSLGLGFACLVTVLGSVFIAGEALDDPGGLEAVGLVLLWAVPLCGLVFLAWRRAARAVIVLEVLTAGMVVVAASLVVIPATWRSLEHGHGPVVAVGVFILMLPIAVLGWRRPRLAGCMLLLIGVASMVASTTRQGSGSMRAIALPVAIDGVIFLLAGVEAGRARHHTRTALHRATHT